MRQQPALAVTSLEKRFGPRRVLRDIALELHPGQVVLLCGTNGAGKTTLLRILAGLERPDRCRLTLEHEALSWRRCRGRLLREVLYLHQQPYMFDGTVSYNLAYALPRNLPRQRRRELVDRAVTWAGLEHLREAPAKSLSGGERQRVSLARAWLRKPRMLLLDEPTANLDQASRQRTLELLAPFKQAGMSLIIATHDTHHFSSLTDRSLYLQEGCLIETAPAKLAPVPSGEPALVLRSSA